MAVSLFASVRSHWLNFVVQVGWLLNKTIEPFLSPSLQASLRCLLGHPYFGAVEIGTPMQLPS